MNSNYVFIGDNLTVLNSVEFKTVVGTVDTIYIDPPYNTKNKFSYNDKQKRVEWLSFMKDRLEASKKFLKDTGVIFISIDDNEYSYLKNLCDDIFGEENLLGTFITKQALRSNAKHINTIHEYVLSYAKNKNKAKAFKIKRIFIPEERKMINNITSRVKAKFTTKGEEAAKQELNNLIQKYCQEYDITWLRNYSSIDDNGDVYFGKDLSIPGKPREVNIPEIGLTLKPLPTRGWTSDKKFKELHEQGKLVFKNNRPYEKHLLTDAEDNAISLLDFYSRQGSKDLNNLGLRDLFDTPKPVELIKYLIRISTPSNGVVLDYFAGSGTTGQAVYETNMEDSASRKYVLVQLPENINKDTKAYNACIKAGVKPIISEVLIHRLNTFLKKNSIEKNFEVKVISESD